MKLGKLIIASLCVFSLCSFSTVAPVQVDAASCSTSIKSVSDEFTSTSRGDFYHPEQHADKNLYSYAFRLGLSGMSYDTLFKRYPDRIDNESFICGFIDGSLYYDFIHNKRGPGRDN